jgi:hypothetical protein
LIVARREGESVLWARLERSGAERQRSNAAPRSSTNSCPLCFDPYLFCDLAELSPEA